jgi:hypothetical protein
MGCTDPGLPQGTGFCLALGSSAPDLTELFVSPLVDSGSGALVRNPTVLAADPSGLLLFSGDSDGAMAPPPPYFLCDAVSNTVRQLPHLPPPDPEHGGDITGGTAGLIVSSHDDGGHDYMVAALAVSDTAGAILHCFSPRTGGGEWVKKTLVGRAPPLATTPQWRTDRVLCLDGKIWWINLSQGILSCDPKSGGCCCSNVHHGHQRHRHSTRLRAGSFGDAFDRAIMDMEFHQFTRTHQWRILTRI